MTTMFEGWPVVSSYSRAEAIEDGVLVDVTEFARPRGFGEQTVVTAALWAWVDEPAALPGGQDREWELSKVLGGAWLALRVAQMEGEWAEGERTRLTFPAITAAGQRECVVAYEPFEGFTIGFPSDF